MKSDYCGREWRTNKNNQLAVDDFNFNMLLLTFCVYTTIAKLRRKQALPHRKSQKNESWLEKKKNYLNQKKNATQTRFFCSLSSWNFFLLSAGSCVFAEFFVSFFEYPTRQENKNSSVNLFFFGRIFRRFTRKVFHEL